MPVEALLSVGVGGLGILVTIILFVISGYKQRIRDMEDDLKEIRKDYVRRDDLNDHLTAIDKSVSEVRDGMRELTKLVLTAIASTSR